MKKMIASLLISGVLFASCKKDKGVDCTSALDKVNKTGQAYVSSQTKENCEAYKAALQAYANSSCFTGLSQEQKDGYLGVVESLNCPE